MATQAIDDDFLLDDMEMMPSLAGSYEPAKASAVIGHIRLLRGSGSSDSVIPSIPLRSGCKYIFERYSAAALTESETQVTPWLHGSSYGSINVRLYNGSLSAQHFVLAPVPGFGGGMLVQTREGATNRVIVATPGGGRLEVPSGSTGAACPHYGRIYAGTLVARLVLDGCPLPDGISSEAASAESEKVRPLLTEEQVIANNSIDVALQLGQLSSGSTDGAGEAKAQESTIALSGAPVSAPASSSSSSSSAAAAQQVPMQSGDNDEDGDGDSTDAETDPGDGPPEAADSGTAEAAAGQVPMEGGDEMGRSAGQNGGVSEERGTVVAVHNTQDGNLDEDEDDEDEDDDEDDMIEQEDMLRDTVDDADGASTEDLMAVLGGKTVQEAVKGSTGGADAKSDGIGAAGLPQPSTGVPAAREDQGKHAHAPATAASAAAAQSPKPASSPRSEESSSGSADTSGVGSQMLARADSAVAKALDELPSQSAPASQVDAQATSSSSSSSISAASSSSSGAAAAEAGTRPAEGSQNDATHAVQAQDAAEAVREVSWDADADAEDDATQVLPADVAAGAVDGNAQSNPSAAGGPHWDAQEGVASGSSRGGSSASASSSSGGQTAQTVAIATAPTQAYGDIATAPTQVIPDVGLSSQALEAAGDVGEQEHDSQYDASSSSSSSSAANGAKDADRANEEDIAYDVRATSLRDSQYDGADAADSGSGLQQDVGREADMYAGGTMVMEDTQDALGLGSMDDADVPSMLPGSPSDNRGSHRQIGPGSDGTRPSRGIVSASRLGRRQSLLAYKRSRDHLMNGDEDEEEGDEDEEIDGIDESEGMAAAGLPDGEPDGDVAQPAARFYQIEAEESNDSKRKAEASLVAARAGVVSDATRPPAASASSRGRQSERYESLAADSKKQGSASAKDTDAARIEDAAAPGDGPEARYALGSGSSSDDVGDQGNAERPASPAQEQVPEPSSSSRKGRRRTGQRGKKGAVEPKGSKDPVSDPAKSGDPPGAQDPDLEKDPSDDLPAARASRASSRRGRQAAASKPKKRGKASKASNDAEPAQGAAAVPSSTGGQEAGAGAALLRRRSTRSKSSSSSGASSSSAGAPVAPGPSSGAGGAGPGQGSGFVPRDVVLSNYDAGEQKQAEGILKAIGLRLADEVSDGTVLVLKPRGDGRRSEKLLVALSRRCCVVRPSWLEACEAQGVAVDPSSPGHVAVDEAAEKENGFTIEGSMARRNARGEEAGWEGEGWRLLAGVTAHAGKKHEKAFAAACGATLGSLAAVADAAKRGEPALIVADKVSKAMRGAAADGAAVVGLGLVVHWMTQQAIDAPWGTGRGSAAKKKKMLLLGSIDRLLAREAAPAAAARRVGGRAGGKPSGETGQGALSAGASKAPGRRLGSKRKREDDSASTVSKKGGVSAGARGSGRPPRKKRARGGQ